MNNSANKISILNLGAGKIRPLIIGEQSYDAIFLVNVDRGGYLNTTDDEVLETHHAWKRPNSEPEKTEKYLNVDAYEFLERYFLRFNHICMYRFLEHIPKDRVLYFIYLLFVATCKHRKFEPIFWWSSRCHCS